MYIRLFTLKLLKETKLNMYKVFLSQQKLLLLFINRFFLILSADLTIFVVFTPPSCSFFFLLNSIGLMTLTCDVFFSYPLSKELLLALPLSMCKLVLILGVSTLYGVVVVVVNGNSEMFPPDINLGSFSLMNSDMMENNSSRCCEVAHSFPSIVLTL